MGNAEKHHRRQVLFKQRGGFCQRCGRTLHLNKQKASRFYARIHHILHQSDGGTNANKNLLLTCTPCEDEYHYKEAMAQMAFHRKTQVNGERLYFALREAGVYE